MRRAMRSYKQQQFDNLSEEASKYHIRFIATLRALQTFFDIQTHHCFVDSFQDEEGNKKILTPQQLSELIDDKVPVFAADEAAENEEVASNADDSPQ